MTLLVLGDSQVSRVWSAVKANRECLKTGSYEAVKNRDALMPALGGIGEKVCINLYSCLTDSHCSIFSWAICIVDLNDSIFGLSESGDL